MTTSGFFPRGKFIEVSITGRTCQLNCPICGGRWLEGMLSVNRPEDLVKLGISGWKRGARGILISGGYNREGKLPIQPFLWAMRELKRIGFVISVHTGPLDKKEAQDLGKAGVDIADFELMDENSARIAKGLNLSLEDHLRGMENLSGEGIEVVPHIILGLPGSREGSLGEYIDIIRELKIRRTVILGFIPTPGTKFSNETAPSPETLRGAAEELRKVSRVSLGCMRAPWLKREYDRVLLGIVDRIANPHGSLNLERVKACCSIPEELIGSFI